MRKIKTKHGCDANSELNKCLGLLIRDFNTVNLHNNYSYIKTHSRLQCLQWNKHWWIYCMGRMWAQVTWHILPKKRLRPHLPSPEVLLIPCLLPAQFLPVYSLVFFQSHPIELQLDKAKYLCEQHFHQIFPTGSDGSRRELIKCWYNHNIKYLRW